MAARVRVFIASSLDGFIAGPENDLSWLPGTGPEPVDLSDQEEGAVTYEAFIADVGAMLMGRATYDVVNGFGGDWFYGELPIVVATHRPLDGPRPTVRPMSGSIEELVAEAKAVAEGKDVYLDGGDLIRQALDAGLVDHIILTLVPVVLGQGHPLFAGTKFRHALQFTASHRYGGGMHQLHAVPRRDGPT